MKQYEATRQELSYLPHAIRLYIKEFTSIRTKQHGNT